jgi:hypothetical protein
MVGNKRAVMEQTPRRSSVSVVLDAISDANRRNEELAWKAFQEQSASPSDDELSPYVMDPLGLRSSPKRKQIFKTKKKKHFELPKQAKRSPTLSQAVKAFCDQYR